MTDSYGIHKWNYEMVSMLIQLRGKTYAHLFEGKNCNYVEAWKKVLKGFEPYFSYEQVKKKWYNLVSKYKRLHSLQSEEGLESDITWPHYKSIHFIMTRQYRNQRSPHLNDEDSDEPFNKRIKVEVDPNNTINYYPYDGEENSINLYDSRTTPEQIILCSRVQPESNEMGRVRCSSFAYNANYNTEHNIKHQSSNSNGTQNTSTEPPPLIIPHMPALTLIHSNNSSCNKLNDNDSEKSQEDADITIISPNPASARYRNFSNFIYTELLAMPAEQAERLMRDITKSYVNIKYE